MWHKRFRDSNCVTSRVFAEKRGNTQLIVRGMAKASNDTTIKFLDEENRESSLQPYNLDENEIANSSIVRPGARNIPRDDFIIFEVLLGLQVEQRGQIGSFKRLSRSVDQRLGTGPNMSDEKILPSLQKLVSREPTKICS